MKYALRIVAPGLVGILTAVVTLSACATAGRWFEGHPASNSTPSANSQSDLEIATVKYVQQLCATPMEQRDPLLRELNESLLPNNAVISCGRGGVSDSPH
jgi:hypothetical protein